VITAIHQSSLNTALRCGEQFRRRYIEGHIIPPGIAAGRGTGVHKANEINLKQKVVTKKDLPVSDLQDAARDGFKYAFRNGVYLPKEEEAEKNKLLNEGLNDCLRLTKLYRNEVAPQVQPIAIEEPFSIDVGLPLLLDGRIDYQEDKTVHDLKSTGKSWSKDQIQKEIQPVFYSFVHEHERGVRPRFIYHILVALKTQEKLQEQEIIPTDNHYRALFAKLQMFCKMIQTGTFLPANPSSWWCTEKWCGYWHTCPYVGNAKPQTWV
jgi:hypothetical protein